MTDITETLIASKGTRRKQELQTMETVLPLRREVITKTAAQPGESSIAHAKRLLAAAAPSAVATIVDISNNAAEPRERLAAARDILDRNAVGKVVETSQGAAIPVAFLTAALAGIALLAGKDMAGFGDMTTLQEDLSNLKEAPGTIPEVEMTSYTVVAPGVAPCPSNGAAAALTIPRMIAHKRKKANV